MVTKSFRDLIVWQKANDLTFVIYERFGQLKDYGLRDQIQRASISIMNTIAEGYARRADRSLWLFLLIAKGPCAKVESMLVMAARLHYMSSEEYATLTVSAQDTGRLLSAFIKKLSVKDY